ncbi:glycosyltransferase family 4 protein [Caldisericum sp.]|uniref:glycosyltransferase family 4 protein n=1 Tax=Caldisericum sp. TaxID=2499687 RepID=UPI003D0FFB97
MASSASANRWLTLIEGLKNLGVNINMLIYGPYQREQEANDWKEEGNYQGVHFKYINPQIISGYWRKRFYVYIEEPLGTMFLIRKLISKLKDQRGIIWTEASFLGFRLAVEMKKHFPQRRFFLEMSEFLDIHRYNKGNLLQRWRGDKRMNYFNKTAFHIYDGIALMTLTLCNHYLQFPPPRPKVLHLPMTVDLERFDDEVEPLSDFKTPYIAFVGIMNNLKDGVDVLIQAFSKISSDYPQYKLYLIGPWHYDTPGHLKMIEKSGLSDRIFWMGQYSREKIPAIIGNADLLVLPRPDSHQARGGFPTKLGEYLASGVPVCATRVGEIPDYLRDGESIFFAEPGSVESFADAMSRALSDPEAARHVGANGRKVAVTYFNQDIQARRLHDFLQGLLME